MKVSERERRGNASTAVEKKKRAQARRANTKQQQINESTKYLSEESLSIVRIYGERCVTIRDCLRVLV